MAMEPLPDRLGPRMAVLTDLQRKFCWLMAGGMENASGAAREAGYSDNGSLQDNGKSGIRVLAHRLMQDPRILDAIEECGRARLRMLAPMAINQVRAIYQESIDQYQRAARRRTYRQGLAQLVMSALVSGFKSVGPPRDRVKRGRVEKNGRRSPALTSR